MEDLAKSKYSKTGNSKFKNVPKLKKQLKIFKPQNMILEIHSFTRPFTDILLEYTEAFSASSAKIEGCQGPEIPFFGRIHMAWPRNN